MSKHSNEFEREGRDFYPTPEKAMGPLYNFLPLNVNFIEPCAGDGAMVGHLEGAGHKCLAAFDLDPQAEGIIKMDATKGDFFKDMSAEDVMDLYCFITNPPWKIEWLHPIIERLLKTKMPFWLLIYADWMFTEQDQLAKKHDFMTVSEIMKYCHTVQAIPRQKWIPGSKHDGKDNCCWFGFGPEEAETVFYTKGAFDE
ncbi:hypothetical protein KAR91_51865 [Candidatus Pacearchaeota archaeon]|nr:hypothetical protein [Candidatus Pacearchaeota archaeon]